MHIFLETENSCPSEGFDKRVAGFLSVVIQLLLINTINYSNYRGNLASRSWFSRRSSVKVVVVLIVFLNFLSYFTG